MFELNIVILLWNNAKIQLAECADRFPAEPAYMSGV